MKFPCFVICSLLFVTPAFCEASPDKGSVGSTSRSAISKVKGWFHHGKDKVTEAKTDKVKRQALRIPTGSPVKVTQSDGSKLQGSLMKVSSDGIAVKPAGASTRQIAYEQIDKLKQIRGPQADEEGYVNTGKVNDSLDVIPVGAPVTVRMEDKSKVSGRYLGKSDKSVQLQALQGSSMTDRTLPISSIASIRENKAGLIRKPKFQSPDLVKKNVTAVPPGSPLTVRMPDGKSISGKLTGHTPDGFSLQALEGGNIVEKNIPYAQVAGVQPVRPGIKQRIPGLQTPAAQSSATLKTAALGIPTGSPVTVHAPDGTVTAGRLTGVSDNGLQLVTEKAGSVMTQNMSYDQVGSIKQGIPPTPTQRAKKYGTAAALVIVTGVVSGALAGVIK